MIFWILIQFNHRRREHQTNLTSAPAAVRQRSLLVFDQGGQFSLMAVELGLF